MKLFITPNINNRICIRCNKSYKPTSGKQKVCINCRLPNEIRKLNYSKKWYKSDLDKHRLNLRISFNKYIKESRKEILSCLGGKCKKCGFNDYRALQLDHINGDGNKDRKLHMNSYKFYKHVKENISNFQILCANCNWIKRYENKEHGYKERIIRRKQKT